MRFRRINELLCVCFFRDAIQSLQDEVTTLRERLERCLTNKKPLSSGAAPPAEDTYTPHYTSTPHIRLVFDEGTKPTAGRRESTEKNRTFPMANFAYAAYTCLYCTLYIYAELSSVLFLLCIVQVWACSTE